MCIDLLQSYVISKIHNISIHFVGSKWITEASNDTLIRNYYYYYHFHELYNSNADCCYYNDKTARRTVTMYCQKFSMQTGNLL